MASKRATQVLCFRSTSSLSRQAVRSSFQTVRAFSAVTPDTTSRARISSQQTRIAPVVSIQQKRWDSRAAEARGTKIYQFEDVLDILEQPSNSRLLIDVREPHEFEANTIPTSINIPVTSQPDALLLDDADFEDRFGFAKPPKGKEIVFFCKAGVRSSSAAGLARQAGYKNIGEYRGSWLDWQKRGGPGTKTPPKPEGMGEPTAPVTETKPTGRTGESGEEDLGEQGGVQYPKGGLMGTRQ